ncbi:MAG TPA: DUF4012 domain-containing protein [Patescibacteria group bacterium]|nr:DUF4012 domain-containing protein [Patescibacteria group bacterium]
MRQKQKKLNRLSDMGGLVARMTDREWKRLLESRIVKFRPHRFSSAAPRDLRQILSAQASGQPIIFENGAFVKEPVSHTLRYERLAGFFSESVIKTRELIERCYVYLRSILRIDPRILRTRAPSLAVFLGIALLTLSVFPLLQGFENKRLASSQVMGAATEAFEDLQSGGVSMLNADYATAHTDLSRAYDGFSQAVESLQGLGSLINAMPQTEEGRTLLLAGQDATLALQYLSAGMDNFQSLRLGPSGLVSETDRSPDLIAGLQNFQEALKYLTSLKSELQSVRLDSIPQEYRDRVASMTQMLDKLTPGISELIKLHELLIGFLEGDKTYLMLFQNSRELRATGGFIGTYGIISLHQGQIANLKIESVYNPDGQLKDRIVPPLPLQQYLTTQWGLRDSNWFFDFPQSAREAADFLDREVGQKVDGVMAFTPALFERLMQLVGPIAMPEYGEVLTAENFTDVVQYRTSVAYDRVLNQPKKFLADFAPRLLLRLNGLTSDGWLQFLDIIVQSLQRKDILLTSFSPDVQGKFSELRWTGAVREAPSDYLAIVDSNVGAGKTDQNISEDITLESQIQSDGSVDHRLHIHLTYRKGSEKLFPVNKTYARVYVPKGSYVLSAVGFDALPHPAANSGILDPQVALLESNMEQHEGNVFVSEESGKTVFAGWIIMTPDTARDLLLVYRTPKIALKSGDLWSYSMLFQRQPGGRGRTYHANIQLPAVASVLKTYPDAVATDGSLRFEGTQDFDTAWGAVYQ